METDYQPISCGFYDELGLRMMRGAPCELEVQEEDGTETIRTIIRDVFTEGDAEYVRLDDDRRIRLDHILRVDDIPAPDTC